VKFLNASSCSYFLNIKGVAFATIEKIAMNENGRTVTNVTVRPEHLKFECLTDSGRPLELDRLNF